MMYKRFSLYVLVTVAFLYMALPVGAEESSDQQISDFSLTGYGEKGKKDWDLYGKTADIFTDVVALKEVEGNLYGKEEDIKLTAEKGKFDKKQGKVHLQDNVVITTSSGSKLTTNSLDWDRKKQFVSTQDNVNITRDNMVTVAEGATGEPNLRKVTLQKDVQVDIEIEADSQEADAPEGALTKDKIVITCDGPLEIDYEKSHAIFKNNVKVESKDGEIFSDAMDVYFVVADKEKNEAKPQQDKEEEVLKSRIEKIVARGNVKIVRGENISYSERATYLASQRRIVLDGRPRLILYSEGGPFDASIGD